MATIYTDLNSEELSLGQTTSFDEAASSNPSVAGHIRYEAIKEESQLLETLAGLGPDFESDINGETVYNSIEEKKDSLDEALEVMFAVVDSSELSSLYAESGKDTPDPLAGGKSGGVEITT